MVGCLTAASYSLIFDLILAPRPPHNSRALKHYLMAVFCLLRLSFTAAIGEMIVARPGFETGGEVIRTLQHAASFGAAEWDGD